MRLRKLLTGATTLAVLGLMSTSCTNEMVSPYPGQNGNKTMLVHDPDFYAWSGNDYFNNGTKATRASGSFTEITFSEVRTKDLDKDKEEKIIDDYLPEQNENLKEDIQENFLFKAETDISFELYPIYCQTHDAKTVGIFYYDNQGNYGEVENIFNGITQWAGRSEESWDYDQDLGQTVKHTTFIGKKVNIPAGYIFGFFWNGNNNNGVTTYYSIDKWNDECYATTGGGQKIEPEVLSRLHGVTFELEGKTYLGLEDWTDFDFQDLVFTCPENLTEVPITDIPDKGKPWTGETFPGGTGDVDTPNPPKEDNCPKCGDPNENHHDGVCDDCDPDGECAPCPVEGCDHPKHEGEICPKCPEDTQCHPKPEEDKCPVPECGHAKHPGTTCPECGLGDSECNPVCPKDECDHPKHDGKDCPFCPKGSECHPKPGTAVTPNGHKDEVEINYSINDVHTDKNGLKYDNADLWTKLSIHVRKGTDVKVTVPLPKKYFCESDDFNIFQKHEDGIYTGTGFDTPGTVNDAGAYHHEMTYTITNEKNNSVWYVKLSVDIYDEYMEITTDGINDDLIEYLFEKNGDGMNFEIWNYYQSETLKNLDGSPDVEGTLDAFQELLNQSTVTFLDEGPTYYINAFGYNWTNGTYNQNIRPRDCTVTPVDTQYTMDPNFCYHLNGTPWNIIWTKNGLIPDSKHNNHPTPAVPVN